MKKIIKYLIILIVVGISIILSINFYVILSTKKQITNLSELKNKNDYDCIIVLGAGIWGDKPSPMLQDRLDEAIKLYEAGIAPKIIMSGDNGQEGYDEVNVMKDYATQKGIPSEDIFMDHAGFSTYESIYRAKEIFKVEKAIIVTQKYHLYRALHIGNKLGINVTGVGADPRKYSGQIFRELREVLARNKDFIQAIFKLKPTYLGESIPVSGDGNITNDKEKEAE
jgi:vancomycin permeability regulator SanA